VGLRPIDRFAMVVTLIFVLILAGLIIGVILNSDVSR